MLEDNKSSIFLFITWRPTRGRGLHSFETFSIVIIALSRFISYQRRRKGKLDRLRTKHGGHRTVVTKNINEARNTLEHIDLEDMM